MTIRTLAELAIVTGALAASVSGVHAYTIRNRDGRYSVTCEYGCRWTRGNGTRQITHADAANICARRGNSIIDSSGSGNDPGKPLKAVSGLRKLNWALPKPASAGFSLSHGCRAIEVVNDLPL